MSSMLLVGSKGKAVVAMQLALIEKGFLKGKADGDFGPGTKRAVVAYQRSAGLMTDGVVGPRVLASLKGVMAEEWQLTDSAIELAAEDLGVDVASIRTVSEVESAGGGFLSKGVPKILFERHVMNKRLVKNDLGLAARLGRDAIPELVNTKTGGYKGGSKEWVRLKKAMTFSYISAIESASYGRYQIMGYHWKALGYESAEEWLEQMCTSEDEHLNAFVRFIRKDSKLWGALKDKDWAGFARRYNGPGYAKNKYDIKLAAAYARHSEA